jgi:hypothetical protein
VAYVDFASIGSLVGLFVGILLIILGLYSRRGGRLRHRQGAEVLAGFSAVVGVAALGLGLFALLRA